VRGCEEYIAGVYRRVLRLPHGFAIVSIDAKQPLLRKRVALRLQLDDLRDVGPAVARITRMLDLDADPDAIYETLVADPLLRAAITAAPGTRVPGHPDPAELAIRAVLGQQISVSAARRLAGVLVERFGEALPHPSGSLIRAFPTSEALSAASGEDLPMPRSRQRALLGLSKALSEGTVDLSPGADRDVASSSLMSLPGVGPWTTSYITMRALGDPDAFLVSDLGVRRAFEAFGLPADLASIGERAESWRPWRAYALMHLWKGPSDQILEPTEAMRNQSESKGARYDNLQR
jgi:AraC family transcriptional regulator of adaptative response / DNA-3-methyladenine glycosylase II